MSREEEHTECIRGWVKEAMQKDGVTYTQIAQKMGCSVQNVWIRLNGGPVPTVKGLRDILRAFGHDFLILDDNHKPINKKLQERLLNAMEGTKVSYPAAQEIMIAFDWSFVVDGVK